MFLDEGTIITSSEPGWPNFINANKSRLARLHKTEEVLALFAQLSYIRSDGDQNGKAYGAPECYFADWQSQIRSLIQSRTD